MTGTRLIAIRIRPWLEKDLSSLVMARPSRNTVHITPSIPKSAVDRRE
jgi:hypothetical protein